MRTLGILILLSFQQAFSLQAQEVGQLQPGDRIRVTAFGCGLLRQTCVISSLEPGLLAFAVDGQTVRCPVGAVERLEVSLGKRHWWRGSLAGLGIGAVVGGMTTGLFVGCDPGAEDCSRGFLAFLGAVTGGLSGLVIGTVVGGIRGTDTWEAVALPSVRPFVEGFPHGRLGWGGLLLQAVGCH